MTEYYLLTLLQWLPFLWVGTLAATVLGFGILIDLDGKYGRWGVSFVILFLVMTVVTLFAPSVQDYARYLLDNTDTKPGVRARAQEILDRDRYQYKRDKELLGK